MQIDFSFLLAMIFFASFGVWMLFTISSFLMYFFTPKKVVEKYFRPPYFSEAFVEFYSGFPLVLYRGIMFMRLAAYPNSGKKRNLTEVYKELPISYRNVSKFLLIGFFFFMTIFMISLVLSAIFI